MSQPPPNYLCRICNIPGHWIQQCPSKHNSRVPQVPSNYICNKCGIPGHWIQNCPNNQHHYQNMRQNNNWNYNTNYPRYSHQNQSYQNYQSPPSNYSSNPHRYSHQRQNRGPPSSYVCNKCRKPGHWIKDCKLKNPVPPSDYLCKKCHIKGHWHKDCPMKDPDKLLSLNNNELRQLALDLNMDERDTQEFIKDCEYKQREMFIDIDNELTKYYVWMKCKDYLDSNAQGKFLRHCDNNNLSPTELKRKLYDKNERHIYLGWDDRFPFIMRLNKADLNVVMSEILVLCHEDKLPNYNDVDRYLWRKSKEWIGISKHESYHIDSDDYCVDENGKDLNCRYCVDPALYHSYLVAGYIKLFDDVPYIPSDILQAIASFFDINSYKLSTIGSRNDYLLSYWKRHRRFINNSPFRSTSTIFGNNCLNIYNDGSILYHGGKGVMMDPDEFDPGQRIINRKLNMDQMNTLKDALVKYTKNRSYYNEVALVILLDHILMDIVGSNDQKCCISYKRNRFLALVPT